MEIEVSDQEMRQTANRIVDRALKRRTDQEKKEIKLRGVFRMLVASQKLQADPRGTFIQVMKAFSLQLRWEAR